MIQGLRLLPFTADAPIFNCDTCQNGDKKMNLQAQPIGVRRLQACGWMPRDQTVKRIFGLPSGVDFEPECCPGYLTELPEVQETVRIRPQWLKGNFAQYVGNTDADLAPALNAQAVLESAVIAKQNHDTEERNRKAEEDRRNGR